MREGEKVADCKSRQQRHDASDVLLMAALPRLLHDPAFCPPVLLPCRPAPVSAHVGLAVARVLAVFLDALVVLQGGAPHKLCRLVRCCLHCAAASSAGQQGIKV